MFLKPLVIVVFLQTMISYHFRWIFLRMTVGGIAEVEGAPEVQIGEEEEIELPHDANQGHHPDRSLRLHQGDPSRRK